VSFDSIPHSALINRVKEKVTDSRVLELLAAFLTQKVMATAEGWKPEEGTPQGAGISPLLSNIYLDPLDQQMAEQGYEMIRYADGTPVQTST
jgi:RNA-directed DNA polymerase